MADAARTQPIHAPPPALALRALSPMGLVLRELGSGGWLMLISGIAIVSACVLIPAQHDLAIVTWQRDRAGVVESQRMERIDRYIAFIDALQQGQESAVTAARLHSDRAAPPGWRVVEAMDQRDVAGAVYAQLEPPPVSFPAPPEQTSTLGRLTTHPTHRLWVMGAGMMALLIGLLPRETPEAHPEPQHG